MDLTTFILAFIVLTKFDRAYSTSYTVVKVTDGDTISVRVDNQKKLMRVRFLCIDAPEISQQKWGPLALNKLSELVPVNSQVELKGTKKDQYKRTLAYVTNSNGQDVNKNMMESGYVALYPYQKGCNEFKPLQEKAQKDKIGIWSDPDFELPWEYRRRMGIGRHGKKNKNTN